MGREALPTWFFALVVVQQDDKFLLVHERKHGQGWYLPAGRVEPGESLVEAAVRETLEETGVPVEIDGIFRLEHTPSLHGVRVRVIFSGHPADDTPPRSEPNEDTLGAAWVTLEEMRALPLRNDAFPRLLEGVASGRVPRAPLTLLGPEGVY